VSPFFGFPHWLNEGTSITILHALVPTTFRPATSVLPYLPALVHNTSESATLVAYNNALVPCIRKYNTPVITHQYKYKKFFWFCL